MPPSSSVPLVDLAAFESGTPATQQRIAQQVDDACQHTGFLAIAQSCTAWILTEFYRSVTP